MTNRTHSLRATLALFTLSASVLTGTACSRSYAKLTPAPGTATVSGVGQGAEATVAGVHLIARTGAWKFDPSDLATKVTPILVEFENNADMPVSIRYNRIALTDEAGHKFMVMPPYDINGTVTEAYTVTNPYYGLRAFAVAP